MKTTPYGRALSSSRLRPGSAGSGEADDQPARRDRASRADEEDVAAGIVGSGFRNWREGRGVSAGQWRGSLSVFRLAAARSGQQAMTAAMARQNSGQRPGSTLPALRSRRSTGTSWTLSRLATHRGPRPSGGPSPTSVPIPRIVVVIGATSTLVSLDATRLRVRMTTGRTLSRSAHHTSPWPSLVGSP